MCHAQSTLVPVLLLVLLQCCHALQWFLIWLRMCQGGCVWIFCLTPVVHARSHLAFHGAVVAVDSVPFPPLLFRAWYSKALKPIVYSEPADDFTESRV